MKKLKIGIIGVGNISSTHIEGYLKNPACELYAFCDINPETLKEKGEKYGITRLYGDCNEMLAALPELDAVRNVIAGVPRGSSMAEVDCTLPVDGTDVILKGRIDLAIYTGKDGQAGRLSSQMGARMDAARERVAAAFVAKRYDGDLWLDAQPSPRKTTRTPARSAIETNTPPVKARP